MKKDEFIRIRNRLGKSQQQLACLLGVSLKAVQSYEQGWRRVPPPAERQLLFLLAKFLRIEEREVPCWEQRDCAPQRRRDCPAWEFGSGHLCWFISGTLCEKQACDSWHEKMKICRSCSVFAPLLLEEEEDATAAAGKGCPQT